jgi:hypothetical protein
MLAPVRHAYRRFEDARPLVRPTYSELEVRLLPPFGDPEVHVPAAIGTYVAAGFVLDAVTRHLREQ